MRAIIFDLDDTLYRRADFVQSGFAAVARYAAAAWPVDHAGVLATLVAAHHDHRERREFQAVCDEHRLPQSAVPDFVSVFRRHQPAIALDPGVVRMLRGFRADGWRLAVLTNGAPSVQRLKARALDLDRHVDVILYAEEHAPGGKPHAAAFHAALDHLGLPPSRCLFVGDDPDRDIDGAHRAGLRTIRVAVAGRRAHPERHAGAVVTAVTEVPLLAGLLLEETVDAA
jgi:putative hydrolase of the HAD superfamily